jgi:uncharacterized protein YdcH (DUF465 family)
MTISEMDEALQTVETNQRPGQQTRAPRAKRQRIELEDERDGLTDLEEDVDSDITHVL